MSAGNVEYATEALGILRERIQDLVRGTKPKKGASAGERFECDVACSTLVVVLAEIDLALACQRRKQR